MRFRRMRTGISFTVSLDDRLRLQAIVAAPRSLQKHVWRARIILLSDGDQGCDRQVEDLHLALAGAVHDGGRRWPAS